MHLLRTLYYALGPRNRRIARRLFFFPADVFDAVFGKRLPLVPPKGKIFTGKGDFVKAGDDLLENLITYCDLQPHHHVLDVGCGIGRVARPLAAFLDPQHGSYEGFDIVGEGISWCQKKYKEHPNFRFTHIPLKNDLYNLDTDTPAESFIFPYPDSMFDQVVLTSVFTHMQPPEVVRYLNEITRVLKPGGHCFSTFFLITSSAEAYLDKAANPFFPYRYDDYFLHDHRVKNANIAYRDAFIREQAAAAGLSVTEFYEGWWTGRPKEECLNFQDVLIMKKP
ncbi:MAG: class I SAM-dependent methyltransferase [Bacteroidales bacterium]|nr:class I SAM-dependent methyltransferase [Bacteroidales bacterium]